MNNHLPPMPTKDKRWVHIGYALQGATFIAGGLPLILSVIYCYILGRKVTDERARDHLTAQRRNSWITTTALLAFIIIPVLFAVDGPATSKGAAIIFGSVLLLVSFWLIAQIISGWYKLAKGRAARNRVQERLMHTWFIDATSQTDSPEYTSANAERKAKRTSSDAQSSKKREPQGETAGEIVSFLHDKGYGFIKGDDQQDYFFHIDDLVNQDEKGRIAEGAAVSFDRKATPKGYRAVRCHLLDLSETTSYIEPDSIVTSKIDSVKGWETLQTSDWIVFGSSSDSPDEARREVKLAAQRIGANAVLNMEYFKTTGSRPSKFSGINNRFRGTYRYTIHNFCGTASTVGKRHINGNLTLNELTQINNLGAQTRSELDQLVAEEKRRSKVTLWLTGAVVVGGAIATAQASVLFLGGIAWIFVAALTRPTDDNDWLQHRHAATRRYSQS